MIRFLIYTAVLYGGLVHNVFCVQEDVITLVGTMRAGHSPGDDALAINRMRQTEEGPWGSMAAWNGAGWTPYRSQLGLTGIVLAAVQRATGESPERVAAIAGAVMGLLVAALLAAFFASVAVRITPMAGHLGTLLAACCPPLLNFAPSLYWTLPASLAPFVFAWFACPPAGGGYGKWFGFSAGIAALVWIKSLCGYEYISTVVAAPAVAVVYHRAAAGVRIRKWVLPVAVVGFSGCIGLAVAMGLHARQIQSITGGDGFALIRERAGARTSASGDLGHERVAYPVYAPEWLPGPSRNFVNYFFQPIVSSPQTWGRWRIGASLGVMLGATVFASIVLWRKRGFDPAAAALAPAAAVALGAGASWQLLAVNHMVLHGHLNLIVYCVPFAPLAFATVGAALARLPLPRHAGAFAAALLVVAVVWNFMQQGSDEHDSNSEERVRAVLRGEANRTTRGNRSPAPVILTLPAAPGHLPDFASFNGTEPPAADGAHIGVYCWVPLRRERTARVPMTVVLIRGSEIVPARVAKFRLAGFEQTVGHQATFAAFHAVTSFGREPLRVFVVPWDAVSSGFGPGHFRGVARAKARAADRGVARAKARAADRGVARAKARAIDRGVAGAKGAGPARPIAARGGPGGVVGWMHVVM